MIRTQNAIKEFKINQYLKLKLENGRTNIYVKNRMFRQCMYLLLNIPVTQIEDYEEIDSIDEAAEKLDRGMERDHNIISPEEEFMGHSSNLQVWAESGYDTRILHRNIAFPLLKRLTEVGDPGAKQVFKEEIALRLSSGHPTVINYLIQNGYLKYLNVEEFESILDIINPNLIEEVSNRIKNSIDFVQNGDLSPQINYIIKDILRNFGLEHITLIMSKILDHIPQTSKTPLVRATYKLFKNQKRFPLTQFVNQNLHHFKDFDFEFDFIRYKENIVGIFKDEKMYLRNQNITNITDIGGSKGKLDKVKELDLSHNHITNLEGIDKFPNLKLLKLNNNRIKDLEGITNLKKLEGLYLRNNLLTSLSGMRNLLNLKSLDLSGNPNIIEIPEFFNDFSSLTKLKLWNCNIKNFTESTSKFFWMDQNYRYYTGYSQRDKDIYERTHGKPASQNNALYKHFVQWVFKMRRLMLEKGFTLTDIENFNSDTLQKAIWSGTTTLLFRKWLFNKPQKKITDFL
ncbi:MAG: leucine-rich repeat domain-containing protein [Promethearchaeota archaeon]